MSQQVAHPKLRLPRPPEFLPAEAGGHFSVSTPGQPLELEAERSAQGALATPLPSFTFPTQTAEEFRQPEGPESDVDLEDDAKSREQHWGRRGVSPGGDANPVKPAPATNLGGVSGLPLDPPVRSDMENRFGHDFSHVRVFADARAADSARSFGARAYALGSSLVFGAGQYAPRSSSGRDLLAHELAHVVQSDLGRMPSATVARRIFDEPKKDDARLTEADFWNYLEFITNNNLTEGGEKGADKAIGVVKLWMGANPRFNLQVRQKILLIRELTQPRGVLSLVELGNEDELAVLDLLAHSEDIDLRIIFSGAGVRVDDLEKAFFGKEQKALHEFYDRRFEGGLDALRKGEVKPRGGPAAGTPSFGYAWPVLRARFEEKYTVSEALDYVKRLTDEERKTAIADMHRERASRKASLNVFVGKLSKAGGTPSDEDKKKAQAMWDYIVKIDAVLASLYAEAASGARDLKKSEILKETTALSADQKAAARQALAPDVKPKTPGTATDTFTDPQGYEKELRDKLDKDIKAMYEGMVKDKEEKEHGDPALTYPLKRFEELANVAQQETDPVFEGYVQKRSPKAGPVFKADAKGAPGNIHDLWAKLDKKIRDDARVKGTFRRDLARELIFYDLQSDEEVLNVINREHFAAPKFKNDKPINDEAKIQARLAEEYTNTPEKVEKLNKIDRGWGATANFEKHEINVQVFRPVDEKTKKVDEDKDRFFLWDWFQTLIHEYCHTLVNPAYRDYAVSFGTSSVQYNTLMEGVDSWLDEVAWAAIEPKSKSTELREKVEGPEYAKKEPLATYPSITRQRYPTFDQAMQLVNLVGPRNVYAAYFFGKTELIGKGK
jgi:hypothetical protein